MIGKTCQIRWPGREVSYPPRRGTTISDPRLPAQTGVSSQARLRTPAGPAVADAR